jgi:hypothetical protein
MRPALKISLVVFAILLVVGLFLPIVTRIRDAAARIQCSNNLKQIALAVLNYVDTYGKFPPGTRPSPSLPPEQRLSWLFEIVPFVEAGNIYQLAKKDESWDSPANGFLSLKFHCYVCPSGPKLLSGNSSGLTHFVGIAGLGEDAATYPMGDKRNGFFGYDRQVSIKDVTDGIGNTIMIMETALDNGPWAAGGRATVRGVDLDDELFIGRGRQFGGMHLRGGFFERRVPLVNCAMGDGSVRGIASDIDPTVFQFAITIAADDNYNDW